MSYKLLYRYYQHSIVGKTRNSSGERAKRLAQFHPSRFIRGSLHHRLSCKLANLSPGAIWMILPLSLF
ncbi:hypothetical protein [Coleofasciculus sp. G2-EDA-02]|uniref:hypothetical protein n=1 Tax=Coleofasciculus sp. G2-EDA-02 TaxID=3069529 RepID=UPI0032FD017B